MSDSPLFPRDGLLEREIQDTIELDNVEARQDTNGNIWLIIKRDQLDFLLEHCREVDRFFAKVQVMYESMPESLGKP